MRGSGHRPARIVAATMALVITLAGCSAGPTPVLTPVSVPTTPTAVPSAFAPGADGLGDSYYPKAGNGGYDVGNYDLDVTYDPATQMLDGVATITATATSSLSTFNLDLHGLQVQTITVDGAVARADQQGDELVVTPANGILSGAKFVTKIGYGGVPSAFRDPGLGQMGFLKTPDGAVAIGEPQVAASWYPVNDHPRDKATYTIKITAPDAVVALSNGVLKDKAAAATRAGFTSWTWVESSPMASYLATMVVGTFRLQESTYAGLPMVLAVHTSLPLSVDIELAKTPLAYDFLVSEFGPYPFDALGGIVISTSVGFALENQTRPIYAPGFFSRGDASDVIVHELAHQWFGDSVSVNEWKEIWLNEGFATYAEWLYRERQGSGTAQQRFDQYYANVQASSWRQKTGEPTNLFDQFAIYYRGAMTLQALRVTVGDDAFFKILKAWPAEKKYANATTTEFVNLSERISGRQLDALFDAWLYGTERPPKP